MKKADGESFVSALYKKYENDEEEQLEIEILVPKSAPGYTSQQYVCIAVMEVAVAYT